MYLLQKGQYLHIAHIIWIIVEYLSFWRMMDGQH